MNKGTVLTAFVSLYHMPLLLCFCFIGSCLDEGTAIVDGYNSYYGFPRSKSGYSGKRNVIFFTYHIATCSDDAL
jgi:hypothetical protein